MGRQVDTYAVAWEKQFGRAAAELFEQEYNDLVEIMHSGPKEAVDWQRVQKDWQSYYQDAGDKWRETFVPLIEGVILDQGNAWNTAMGFQFDVRNLFAEQWFDNYVLEFAQPINDTTKDDIDIVLQQAMQEGWTITQMQENLGLIFEQWQTGSLSPEEFTWFKDRTPPHRRELIARTETIRASNAGSFHLFQDWGVTHKEWLATADKRTRDGHLEAWADYREGGNIGPIPIDEPFLVRGAKGFDAMMFPGDPNADISNFANCRCTVLPYKPEWDNLDLIVVEQEEVPLPREFPDKVEELEHVRDLGGSTGARLMRDPVTGKLFVLKYGNSQDHIEAEIAVNEFYRTLGVNVPNVRKFVDDRGRIAQVSQYLENMRSLQDFMNSNPSKAQLNKVLGRIQKHFAIDSLVGNWDVIGMGLDNIMIDEEDQPWRIDNGGVFNFRAQGTDKGDKWNPYVTELWTLRNAAINPSAEKIFGTLAWEKIETQLRTLSRKTGLYNELQDAIAGLPGHLRPMVQARYDNLMDTLKVTTTLADDQWVPEYRDKFMNYSNEIRQTGMIDKLSDLKIWDDRVEIRDASGRPFDNMRGRDSIMFDFEAYMSRIGGSMDVLRDFQSGQAGDSWSMQPQARKYWLAKQRDVPLDQYYWQNGVTEAEEHYKQKVRILPYGRNPADSPEQYDVTMTAYNALTYEILRNVKTKRSNMSKGYIELARTENRSVTDMYGLQDGDSGVMVKGAAESGSVVRSVVVQGNILTLQRVPFQRVTGIYWLENRAGTSNTPFMGDGENELLFMGEGLKTHVVGKVGRDEPLSPYWSATPARAVKEWENAGT